jgi:hypothetical protein
MISLGWVHPHQGAILILDVMGTCAGINETRVCMFSDEVVNGHHNNTCHSRLCRGEPTTPAQCTSASPAQAVPRMLRLIHRAEVEQALLNSPAESSCGGVPQFREILFKNLMSLRPPPPQKNSAPKVNMATSKLSLETKSEASWWRKWIRSNAWSYLQLSLKFKVATPYTPRQR